MYFEKPNIYFPIGKNYSRSKWYTGSPYMLHVHWKKSALQGSCRTIWTTTTNQQSHLKTGTINWQHRYMVNSFYSPIMLPNSFAASIQLTNWSKKTEATALILLTDKALLRSLRRENGPLWKASNISSPVLAYFRFRLPERGYIVSFMLYSIIHP